MSVTSTIAKNILGKSIKRSLFFNKSSKILQKNVKYKIVTPEAVGESQTVPDDIVKPIYWDTGEMSVPPKFPEIKSKLQIEAIKSSCALARDILHKISDIVKEGVTTDEIDKEVHRLCISNKAYPSPLNYGGFPKSCCTSVNNVACHGIPDKRRLENGDIVNIDITVFRDNAHGDCSRMFEIGDVDPDGKKLCKASLDALNAGILVCGPAQAIEDYAKQQGLTVIPCFSGHGIGSYFHGPPDIYHIDCPGARKQGAMEAGVTFTIEPVIGEGTREIIILEDGWTACTVDNSRSAQWEHTVLITNNGVEILTK